MIKLNKIRRLFCFKYGFDDSDLTVTEFINKYFDNLEINRSTLLYRNLDKNIHKIILERFENKNEYKFVKDNLINLIGHNIKMNNTFWDEFIQKSIKFGVIKENLDLFENHCFLHYFPHYKTTNDLLNNFINQEKEDILNLLNILSYYSLIKLNEESLKILGDIDIKFEDKEISEKINTIKINRSINDI